MPGLVMLVILFDLEGTIVKTKLESSTTRFRQQTRRTLIELGIPEEALREIETSTLMRNKAREYVNNNFTLKQAKQFHRKLDQFLEPWEMGAARTSKLYAHAISTLRELKNQGYKMGIITNTSTKAANHILKRYRLTEYFDLVITRNHVEKLKPAPEGILLALRRLDAKNFILIGDLSYDAKATKKAGGKSIIIRRTSCDSLEADYVVHSLQQIPSLIRQIT